jgi:arylsulfatase A-like enzyme
MKNSFALLCAAAGLAASLPSGALAADTKAAKPNILFIAIDDLRDWVGYLGYAQAKTPNLDRLAKRGVYFTRAYCANPVCNPSRTALMSGLRSATTSIYSNAFDWRPVIADTVPTLPLTFRANGYYAAGAGKIYHEAYRRPSDWDDYLAEGRVDPDDPEGAQKAKKAKRAITSDSDNDGVGGIKFKPLNCEDKDMVDYATVSYCLKQLEKKHDKPLFLACGLHKPHMPWDVPKKYYEMFPLDKVKLPEIFSGDLEDIPPAGIKMAKPDGDHAAILKSGRWKEAVQGYQAAIAFCDTMVGRLLDGFDKSAYKDNTIICLWSDHGWHLGEKQHWRKFALWEEATRAPFMIIAPGVTKAGGVCERTVDYMSIYPTLCDLAGIPIPKHVQGPSLRPLLENPKAAWDRPAVTTHEFNNHAVRTEQWRYIRYNNGDEELYDHTKDPLEWTNLAGKPELAPVKAELAKWIPKDNKPYGTATDDPAKQSLKEERKAAKKKKQAAQ